MNHYNFDRILYSWMGCSCASLSAKSSPSLRPTKLRQAGVRAKLVQHTIATESSVRARPALTCVSALRYTLALDRYVLDDETKAPAAGGGGGYVVDGVTGAARNPVPQPPQPSQPRANRTDTTSTRQGGAEPSRCANAKRQNKANVGRALDCWLIYVYAPRADKQNKLTWSPLARCRTGPGVTRYTQISTGEIDAATTVLHSSPRPGSMGAGGATGGYASELTTPTPAGADAATHAGAGVGAAGDYTSQLTVAATDADTGSSGGSGYASQLTDAASDVGIKPGHVAEVRPALVRRGFVCARGWRVNMAWLLLLRCHCSARCVFRRLLDHETDYATRQPLHLVDICRRCGCGTRCPATRWPCSTGNSTDTGTCWWTERCGPPATGKSKGQHRPLAAAGLCNSQSILGRHARAPVASLVTAALRQS